ncbi:hypothetical protein F4813DRAFT_398068 [Daldinia decipiens]|uniref:uncharacterized protein n=1 Tax=Daldinia decipiens TaxID=326647 RepID=UPI0020C58B08|nr:uncharacterized protein F4813DRAFT_398068 [Daldinia decipiens]KAI1655702.1 hypothetical protein F4813DRAFT_398068 [Daldinia decipiens]
MSLLLEEVEDTKDFDKILPVPHAAFGEPYNSLRRWLIPVYTTVEAAIEDAKARHIKSWKQHDGIYPSDESQKPTDAHWHIEGTEEKAFAGKQSSLQT